VLAARTTRFTVSLPSELLVEVDRVLGKGNSRSSLVRRLFEDALRRAEERRKEQEWIRGYQKEPQTEEEFGWSDEVTVQALREVPWD